MPTVGLLITTFNRPNYLRQCLESVRRSDIPEGSTIMIVDDASTDPETRRLIDSFDYPGVNLHKSYKSKNLSIKDSLLHGFNFLFSVYNCDIVCNLDGDAIVRKDFLTVLLSLHEKFPDHLLSGFNCRTKNKNGSERHQVFNEGDGWNAKYSVGGINLLVTKENYARFVEPALVKSLAQNLNWDHQTCILSGERGLGIICSVPSVVQHIGVGEGSSSMGHANNGEPADQADDFIDTSAVPFYETGKYFTAPADNEDKLDMKLWQPHDADQYDKWGSKKLQLPTVTLVGADCVNIERLITAADKSCEGIAFGAVKLFSSLPSDDPRVVPIRPLNSKEDYSWFIMKELVDHIDTDYILIIQYDGYPIFANAWRDEWLNYDLIGAVWEWYPIDGRLRVGNGGCSVRSRRLMQVVKDDPNIFPMNEEGVNFNKEEDHVICRIFGKYLQDTYGIKFAPEDEARKFSIESWRNPSPVYRGQFAFHGGNIVFPQSVINKPY